MSQNGKKAAIIFFLLIWFFLISLPVLSFFLGINTQLQIGSAENNHVRIFLLQEKNAEGLGIEIAQPFHLNRSCTQTTIRYWMWKGKPENVTFCQCQETKTGTTISTTPGACNSS